MEPTDFEGKMQSAYFMYTTNIFIVNYTMQTLCVFLSGTTDAYFTKNYSKL